LASAEFEYLGGPEGDFPSIREPIRSLKEEVVDESARPLGRQKQGGGGYHDPGEDADVEDGLVGQMEHEGHRYAEPQSSLPKQDRAHG